MSTDNLGLSLGCSLLTLTCLLASAPALAQTRPSAQPESNQASEAASKEGALPTLEEVVVTGTLLRGAVPTGTNMIEISREDVVASGAVSSNELLASIPQIGYFGTMPRANQDAGSPIVRPNLRNLGASGGSTTLVLLNGHRLVGAGILSTTVDPSVIPPAIVQRVDVVPDGGSSIYGSDAIGGVINFVTRRTFDGVETGLRYGTTDGYDSTDADITVGRDWGSGSAYLSYAYAWHSNLFGADRDWMTSNHLAEGGSDFRSTACAPGNILIGANTYALPDRVLGTLNRCDDPKAIDVFPRETRHTVFGSVVHQFSPTLEFSATAYWSERETQIRTAQSTVTGTITAVNPYFQPIGTEAAHNVSFSFAEAFGPSNVTDQLFRSYGVTPAVSLNLGSKWELRAQANFGRSFNEIHEDTIYQVGASLALGGTTLATALNPYDTSVTDSSVLAGINDYENYSAGDQELAEVRLVADGTLFAMPGGDLRLAIGAEYHYENLDQRMVSAPRGITTGLNTSFSSRNVKAAFAELLIPIFGPDNGHPGMRSLQLSASVRHDSYEDIGGTTNPKFGLTYEPSADLKLRANYGESFHAPGLAESASTIASQAQVLLFSPFRPPGSPITDLFRPTIIIAGANPNLKPETARTWSAGFDWTPSQAPGLSVGLTYYNVDFKNALGLLRIATLFSDPNFAPFLIINPTLEQALAWVGDRTIVGAPSIESLYVGTSPFLLADARINNFGAIKVKGIDFAMSYTRQIGRATIRPAIAGNYTLDRKFSSANTGPFTDELEDGMGQLFFVASFDTKIDRITARAALNYRDGYPKKGLVNQTHVGSFKTVDLFFGYDLPAGGILSDTQLTLNVENVLDEDPPYVNTLNNNSSYFNGTTLGRLYSFGIRKKF